MIKQFRQIILVALRSSFFSSQYLFTRSFINSLKKTPLKILQLFLKTRHINQVFQKSQSKVPQNMPKKLPKTCPKVSKTCPKSYQIHAQIHVQKLPDPCPKVPQTMPKKFPKYAQKVPKTSPKSSRRIFIYLETRWKQKRGSCRDSKFGQIDFHFFWISTFFTATILFIVFY